MASEGSTQPHVRFGNRPTLQGVWTITDIALNEIGEINERRTAFQLSISNYGNDTLTACTDLLDITMTMYSCIDAYFEQDGLNVESSFGLDKNGKPQMYKISDFQTLLQNITDQGLYVDMTYIRRLSQAIFSIWDINRHRLRIALPTFTSDPYRRLTNALFSTTRGFKHEDFMNAFNETCSRLQIPGTIQNFVDYALSRRKYFNKPTRMIIIGEVQIGKSTDALTHSENIYKFWDKAINPDFINNIIWDSEAGIQSAGNISGDIIITDEMFFIGDKRESMNFIQIKYIQVGNALAEEHNITIGNMQEWVDLDERIRKQTDILELIYESGSSLIFATAHNFPIIKKVILDTKKFEDNPKILEDKERGKFELMSLPTFICENNFGVYQNYPVWKAYKDKKYEENRKAISRITTAIKFLNSVYDKEDKNKMDPTLAQRKRIQEQLVKEGIEIR